jgi:FYVE/RhoGEF/PH domain-containing protein 4
VANLLVVCKVYEEALAELPPKTKGMVSVDERRAMFKMFDYLYHAHQDFLQSLQKSVFDHHKDPSVKLGPVFLELASCLKSYRVFMNNYETASNTLAAALKRPAFAAWAEGQEEKFKTKSLPNLLIEPIQRIPRYLLLLNEFLKKMEPTHIDYADFTQALSQIQEAANFLEAEKDKAVHKSKLIELQGQIKGLTSKNIDLSAFSWRRFIHSGQLLLESGKSKMSEYVHFFLLNDLLIVGVEKKSQIHLLHVMEVKDIVVSNIQNDADEGEERNAFQILTERTNMVVSTTKATEKAEWLNAFRQAITEIKSLPLS